MSRWLISYILNLIIIYIASGTETKQNYIESPCLSLPVEFNLKSNYDVQQRIPYDFNPTLNKTQKHEHKHIRITNTR